MVAPVAHLTLLARQGYQRACKPPPLQLRPARLRFIEDGHFRDIVEPQQGDASRASHVQGDGNHDAAQPAGKRGTLLEVAEAPKGPQVGFLGCVLGHARITKHAARDGVGHRLRGPHQMPKRLEVARLGSNNQIVERLHVYGNQSAT